MRETVDAHLEAVLTQVPKQRIGDLVVEWHEIERRPETPLTLHLCDELNAGETCRRLHVVREHRRPWVSVRPEPRELQLLSTRRDKNQPEEKPLQLIETAVSRPLEEVLGRYLPDVPLPTRRLVFKARGIEWLDGVVQPEQRSGQDGALGAGDVLLSPERLNRGIRIERDYDGSIFSGNART